MREILFKAKLKNWKEKKSEDQWVEGYYVKVEGMHFIISDGMICGNNTFLSNTDEFAEIDPETLCPYTGLTDKNGVKIWENDVIRYKDDIINKEKLDLIEYNETHASFIRLHKSQMGLQYLYINESLASKSEVIGNIFNNPELLEVADE